MFSEKNSYLLINKSILRANIAQIISELTPGCSLMPVLKDDAYKLGLAELSKIVSEFNEIEYIAVAHISEGLELRRAGWMKNILVIENPMPHMIAKAIDNDLELSVSRLGLIPDIASPASVQIEINSGLNRSGITPSQIPELIAELRKAGDKIKISGIYSHFSSASDHDVSQSEYECFLKAVSALESEGFSFPMKHISSSASFELFPEYNMNAVRIGRRIYMDAPGVYNGNIHESASWITYISGIYSYKAGDCLGYNKAYTLDHDAVLAIIGVGYGDGLDPALVEVNAPVLIGGKRCPLAACFMDQAMVDVTDVDCRIGSPVTLFGYDEYGNVLPSQEVALLIGDNEGCGLTSELSNRVERIYT